jgi:hypothetical protein
VPDRPSRGERRLAILAEDYHGGSQGGRSVSGFSETEKRTGKDGKQRKLPEPTKPQSASSARRLPGACCSARPPGRPPSSGGHAGGALGRAPFGHWLDRCHDLGRRRDDPVEHRLDATDEGTGVT